MPPLLDLAAALRSSNEGPSRSLPIHLFYGGRGREHLHFLDRFEALQVKMHLCTDDGSLGEAVSCVEAFDRFRKQRELKDFELAACGPSGMLSALRLLGETVPMQLSLEAHMACGVGICRGCAVPRARGGYSMVCTEGPCFESEQLA